MSLDTYESSIESAKPVFLYAFSLNGRTWRYASTANDQLTVDGNVWLATAISHSGVSQTGEAVVDSLSIEASTTIAPVQVYMINPPTTPIAVRIFQKDAADSEVVCIYVGEINQITLPEPGRANLSCETLSVSMRREGLRLGWQRTCPYAVYDPVTCKVPKAAWAVAANVVSVDGFNVTVSGTLAADVYAGGFFEWTHPVKGTEFIAIEAQSGNNLVIFGTTADLYPGLPITLYRGCARTPAACASFGNFSNYGGYPAMPGKSPFDGSPVF